MKYQLLWRILSWIATLLTPAILTLLAIRVLFNPFFLRIEYNLPGFPPDRYGFTTVERIQWAQYAMDYLVKSAGIEYIGDLKFDDGSPLYNQRELKHMVDVKNTVQATFTVLYISLAVLILLGVWAWFGRWWKEFLRGLWRGGWLAVILVGSLILFSVLRDGRDPPQDGAQDDLQR